MKPTLLILAAGMGSRYGSLKQMDGVGPSKEAILDYSVYDAIRAGFGKVVFVIRHSFEQDFKSVFSAERFGNKIEVEYVFQELNMLPKGYSVPEGREKPWGTNHAVMSGQSVITTPFAAINADDFYGREAFQTLADYLRTLEGKKGEYAMVGYVLSKTMSDFGAVSRGVTTVDANGYLATINERKEIVKDGAGALYRDEKGEMSPIDVHSVVSMNFFGFTPDYFGYSNELFIPFLDKAIASGNLKAEYLIPDVVATLKKEGKAEMKVLSSDATWFGVTYKEDKPFVMNEIKKLVDEGIYPGNLWK